MHRKERPAVANVILRSGSGKFVRDAGRTLSHRTVREFLPTGETRETAAHKLAQLGFHIDLVAETHLTISGAKELFEQAFRIGLIERPSPHVKTPEIRTRHTHHVPTATPQIPPDLTGAIEFITFPGPAKHHAVAVTPPAVNYYCLSVPWDVTRLMDAAKAHALGFTGAGVKLAIVDSGFMSQHPYYLAAGYDILPVASDSNDPDPGDDSLGHGTAIAACALAVAPGATLTVYKAYLDNQAAAFARAVADRPHIISCSWELDNVDHALRLAINHAVSQGIVVVASCGNTGPVGWPGYEPAVISVGGAFVAKDGTIQASDYASSGPDPEDPARHVPDVCGIAGQAPHGVLIAMPTQPNSDRDRVGAQSGPYPTGDETAPDDGWSVFSGTSSAAPMVAGVAALVMQANPQLVGDPDAIRRVLEESCCDVRRGASASQEPAAPGVDQATGFGLVQAHQAVQKSVKRVDRGHRPEGRRDKMGKHGGKKRAWLFVRVRDPYATAKDVHSLAMEQQWSPEWAIKRVDTIDHEASRNLPVCSAPHDAYNLLIAVEAANDTALENAFYRISNVVKPSAVGDLHGHVLTSSHYLDWN